MTNNGSNWNAIMQYSFLHVFANDGLIDRDELQMLERLALQDGTVDDQERDVLTRVFARVNPQTVDPGRVGRNPALQDEVRHSLRPGRLDRHSGFDVAQGRVGVGSIPDARFSVGPGRLRRGRSGRELGATCPVTSPDQEHAVLTRTFNQPTRSAAWPPGAMLYLLGAALFAGCVQARTTVKGAWEEGAPRKQSFTRVLVVGVTPNVNQRCAFEFFMASQLTSESVQAIRSCDAVVEKEPADAREHRAGDRGGSGRRSAGDQSRFREIEAKEGGGRDTRGNASYKATDAGFATGYYGVYGVPVIYGNSRPRLHSRLPRAQARVASRLYQTRDKSLVYTLVRSRDANSRSTDAALHDIAAAIADKLRRERLTR